MKRIALVLIPEAGSFSNELYLPICINKTEEDGFIPVVPSGSDRSGFIERFLDIVDVIYLFVNFSMDDLMNEAAEKAFGKKEVRFRKIPRRRLIVSPLEILYDVSHRTGITVAALQSKCRKREIADARFLYFRRAKELTRASLSAIGMPVNRTHCDVIYGIEQALNVVELQDKYAFYYGQTKEQKKTMGNAARRPDNADGDKEERSILSHCEMEKGEQQISEGESFVRLLLGA